MKMLTIDIANAKFVRNNGVDIEQESDNHIVANGWECVITPNGNLVCSARQFYDGSWNMLRYTIRKNGYAILLLQLNNERKILKKGFVIPKGKSVEGTIFLSDGHLNKKQAYFRTKIV